MVPRAGRTEGSSRLRAVAIIPARIGSSRLPRKMLLRAGGRYLFEHTLRNVARCAAVGRVVLATDSSEIRSAARECDLEALMTSPEHPSGTDRVCEALEQLQAEPEAEPIDVVVNVQGDEPDLEAGDLARLIEAFADPAVEMATLCATIASVREAEDPSVVKVVCDQHGDALYFSRATIPTRGHARGSQAEREELSKLRRHVGVYAFRPTALRLFSSLPVSPLEQSENLEQLRWLEAGRRMRVVEASHVPLGIDTERDYQEFVQLTSDRFTQ